MNSLTNPKISRTFVVEGNEALVRRANERSFDDPSSLKYIPCIRTTRVSLKYTAPLRYYPLSMSLLNAIKRLLKTTSSVAHTVPSEQNARRR